MWKGKKKKEKEKEKETCLDAADFLCMEFAQYQVLMRLQVADIDWVILVRYIHGVYLIPLPAYITRVGYDTFPPHPHPPSNPPETVSMVIVCRYYCGDLRVCLCRNPPRQSPPPRQSHSAPD